MKPLRKSDRDAITLLILIILTAAVLFPLLPYKEQNGKEHTNDQQGHSETISPHEETDGVSLFYFDPNTADSTSLRRLGLSKWQIRNIYKYRSRGGIYRCKEDFAQLYGLTLQKYRELEPYIRIKPVVMAADVIKRAKRSTYHRQGHTSRQKPDEMGVISSASDTERENFDMSSENFSRGDEQKYAHQSAKLSRDDEQKYAHQSAKLSRGDSVDANTADTTELKSIPGIGSYLARRIVQLRNSRKQFLSKEELLTIRNFPVEALNYITLSHNYQPIRVNTMSQQELQRHPLLNYIQVRDIMKLRKNTGRIQSVKEMSLLPSFTPERLKAITRYLEF